MPSTPARTRWCAALRPAMPPPMMTTFLAVATQLRHRPAANRHAAAGSLDATHAFPEPRHAGVDGADVRLGAEKRPHRQLDRTPGRSHAQLRPERPSPHRDVAKPRAGQRHRLEAAARRHAGGIVAFDRAEFGVEEDPLLAVVEADVDVLPGVAARRRRAPLPLVPSGTRHHAKPSPDARLSGYGHL